VASKNHPRLANRIPARDQLRHLFARFLRRPGRSRQHFFIDETARKSTAKHSFKITY
jgi:hypothetical protein